MNGKLLLGSFCGLSLLALGAAVELPSPGPAIDYKPKSIMPSITLNGTTNNEAQKPVLVSATLSHIHVILEVSHPSASRFDVFVLYQDKGMSSTSEGFIPVANWKRSDLDHWTARIKIPGDTNQFRVAVHGESNWSNAIYLVP